MLAKKCLLAGILTLLSLGSAFAGPIPVKTPGIPDYESIAYRPVVAPVIDGDLSDWMADAQAEWVGAAFKYFGEQKYVLRGDWAGPEDGSILWSVMWDDTHVYFAAVIWDDVLTTVATIPTAWQGDCIFLYWDCNADGDLDHLSNLLLFEGEAQVISWNNENVDPDRVPYPDGQVAIVMDTQLGDAGRFVEAAIPREHMPDFIPEVGTYFKLNVGLEEGSQAPDGGKFLCWSGTDEPGDPGNQFPVYFSDPVFMTDIAAYPEPVNNALEIPRDVTLKWSAGKYADTHDVYFGTNWDDVNNADTSPGVWPEFKGNQDPCSFIPGMLDIGRTYYWRVDEVNDGPDPYVYQGEVWTFTVANFLVVDDFEDYNDYPPDDIFGTWIDGYGIDENGALVGYDAPDIDAGEHFVETSIVHGGKQSMPYFYNNIGGATYSEAQRMFSPGRDWTREGVETLSIWLRGNPASVGSFVEAPPGTYTMTGSGTDIWSNADEFHFAFKETNGTANIIAKVESASDTDPWAKAGVMIRDTLDADSRYAGLFITPENGVRFQYRNTTGGVTDRQFVEGIAAPHWVKLERTSGGLVRAYHSADGTTWERFNLMQVAMNTPMYVGLAVTSHDAALTCEAKFSNVSFPNTNVDMQWTDQDVGMLSNEPESMYVTVGDSSGMAATVRYDDPSPSLISDWTEWNIPLTDFSDQGVVLTDVDKLAIGFGSADNPQPGCSGLVYFDDIRLYLPREPAQE